MPIENVRYTVTGANPTTGVVQVNFADNGTGTGSITIAGNHPGADLVQAFIDELSLSSNQAQADWWSTNGPISVVQGMTTRVGAGDNTGEFPVNASLTGPVQHFNGLMFNSYPQSIFPSDPHQGGNAPNAVPGIPAPCLNNGVDTNGQYTGDTVVQGVTGSFNMSCSGSFVIAQAGQITFQVYVNSVFLMAVQGASYVSGPQYFNGVTQLPATGLAPQVGSNNEPWPGGEYAVRTFTLNFPAPGVYAFEACATLGQFQERQFCVLANNAVIPTIPQPTFPAAPPPGTGNLILTPNAAVPDVVGTTRTFTIVGANLTFQQQQYMPFLEGTAGSFLIANDPSNPVFTFPTLPNGGTVDPNVALASIFSLSGDNTSWQNRIAITWNGTCYQLNYNGAAIDPNVAETMLTLQNSDLAWYNPANNAIDIYGVTNQGGGSVAQLPIYWLVNPTVASVAPTGLTGDGGTYTIAFTFVKPLPPIQNSAQATFTAGAGFTILSSMPNLNSSGWITGYTVTVTTSVLSGNQTSSISFTLTDNQSYMQGTTLTTAALTYPNINGHSTTLTLTGTGVATVPGVLANRYTITCPTVDMYVDDALQVANVRKGDLLDCLSEDFACIERHGVEAIAFAEVPCIHLVTANGAAKTVSTNTPVPTVEALEQIAQGATKDEIAAYAWQIRPGMHLYTEIDGQLETSQVVEATAVGMRPVAKISLGGRNFAGGVDPRRRIFTHNIRLISK